MKMSVCLSIYHLYHSFLHSLFTGSLTDDEDMETEPPQPQPQSPSKPIHHSSVDTSRPFSSVKEAVAIFGERLISGELYSYPKPLPSSTPRRLTSISFSEIQPAHENTPRSLSEFSYYYSNGFQNGESAIVDTVRRIQADLEQTKTELRILKMRESETEVILASLNAELHRSMSIIAKAEAVEASMAAKERENLGGDRGGMREKAATLGQILNCREEERFSWQKTNSKKKMKKPIVPLLRDLFSRKKNGDRANHHHLN